MNSRSSIFHGADESDTAANRALHLMRTECFREEGILEISPEMEALFAAVDANDVEAVAALVMNKHILNNRHPERDGNTALHVATENDQPTIIRILLEAGADSEISNEFGLTPLALAAADSEGCGILAELAPAVSRREALVGQVDTFIDF